MSAAWVWQIALAGRLLSSLSFKIYLFLIEGYLLYNGLLASAIRQHGSAIGIHMSPRS